jgi:hypothetical protein
MRKVPTASMPAKVAIAEKPYAESIFLKSRFARAERDGVRCGARDRAQDGSRGL